MAKNINKLRRMLVNIRFRFFLFFTWLLLYSNVMYAEQSVTTPTVASSVESKTTTDSHISSTEAPYLYADEDTDIFDEPLFLYADENINLFSDEEIAPKQQDKSFLSFMDTPEQTISSGFEAMVRGIDEFFANEKTAYTSTGSFLRITTDLTLNEGGDYSTRGDLKIRAKFPLTERKLKLTIESDPDEQRSELEREQDTPVDREDKSLYAGLASRWGDADGWQLEPSIGVRIRSPLDYYVRLRTGRSFSITEKTILDLFQSVYWFDSTGYGADTNIDYNYLITDDLVFRSGSVARYTEENEYWDLSQNFYLTQRIDDKRAILYQAGVFAISEPTVFATDYLVLVRYRQRIHKDWMYLEVTPQVLYQKEFDFKAEHSLLLRLEMYFRR